MIHEKLNILLVEDDDIDRKQIKRALKHSGVTYQTMEVVDMPAALLACQTQTFDCAIVDYRLPGQDGLAGISELLKLCPDLAIIMATGQGDEFVATEVMKRGAADYLTKQTVDGPILQRTILAALDKRELQLKLDRQREELQSFASVLAHDLKSPTRRIRSMIDLVQDKMSAEDLDEEVTTCLGYICNAANTMDALVDALTAYTKFDITVEFTEISLDECVAMAVSMLEHTLKEKKAQVTFQDLPTIYGHEPQLIQLFQNLIANAVKYNESETPTVVFSAQERNNVSHITIKDNGIGIPEKHYITIFQPLKRLHGNDKYAGSGLGLATCKKIVERHDGTITCQSEQDQGTTFCLTLPSTVAAPVMR